MCVFCEIVAKKERAEIVFEDETTIAFLDARPLFVGHVLVSPREHHVTLSDLPPALVAPLFANVQRVAAAVERGLGADGSFVAINNRVSQSVAHLHVHVVPRRKGDGLRGFFWPRVKVTAEESKAAAEKIREALE